MVGLGQGYCPKEVVPYVLKGWERTFPKVQEVGNVPPHCPVCLGEGNLTSAVLSTERLERFAPCGGDISPKMQS